MSDTHYTIHGVNGPVVTAEGGRGLAMMDLVYVGDEGPSARWWARDGDTSTIQVYEGHHRPRPRSAGGQLGRAMSILLGPGLADQYF